MDKPIRTSQSVRRSYDDEMTLTELYFLTKEWLHLIRNEQKTIWITIAVMVSFGMLIAFGSQKEYSANIKVITDIGAPSGKSSLDGRISGLAGLVGINLPQAGSGRVITESSLPTLQESYPFLRKVAEEPLRFHGLEREMSALEYFEDIHRPSLLKLILSYTIGLPVKILSLLNRSPEISSTAGSGRPAGMSEAPDIRNALSGMEKRSETESKNSPDTIDSGPYPDDGQGLPVVASSKKEPLLVVERYLEGILNTVLQRIEIEPVESVLEITATMPDPYAAADLASAITDALTEEIINLEIKRTKQQLRHIDELFKVQKKRYEKAQYDLALFRDRNQGIPSAVRETELENLQNEYRLAYNLYQSISEQREQIRIRLSEDTPVFTVLDPVRVPQKPSSLTPGFIFILMFFLGGLLGAGIVTGRRTIRNMNESRQG